MAPSMVVLLKTPLILLPMRLMPNDSPRFDVFLKTIHIHIIKKNLPGVLGKDV